MLVDLLLNDNTIHIKVDSSHIQKDIGLTTFMLEQMIIETYQGATVTKNYNSYGLLTDMYIKFTSVNDATHFKLSKMYN